MKSARAQVDLPFEVVAPLDVPLGWVSATLPDLLGQRGILTDGDWVESKDQDQDGEVRLIQLADIGDGYFRDRSDRHLTSAKATALQCTLLQAGDLLIARMPDPLGRSCIFPGVGMPACTVVDVCIFRPGTTLISNKWMMHAINSSETRMRIAAFEKGTTRKRISKKNLSAIHIPIPPFPEQELISAKLDEHLTKLDAAVAGLKRVQANLKRYRASVLKAAVEGRLVPTEAELARQEGREYEPASVLLQRILVERRRRWEEAELAKMKAKGKTPRDDSWKEKYPEPAAPDIKGLPPLPEGWCWVTLDQLAWTSGYGTSSKCTPTAEGPPVLRIPNVANNALSLDDMKYAVEDLGVEASGFVAPGDYIVIRTNGSRTLIGRAAFVSAEIEKPHYFASYLIRFRLLGGLLLGRWLSLYWQAPETRALLEQMAATSAGQYNLSMTSLLGVPIPVPPYGEIDRLCQSVDTQLSVADTTAADLTTTSERTARLRQSILKWAFEGKLVDQDPNDEPASALLARIRAERESTPTAPRTRARSPSPRAKKATKKS